MSEKKIGFLEKVLEHLNGGEESKLKKFKKDLDRWLDKQISAIQEEIYDLENKVEEAEEKFQETLLNVSMTRVKETDSRKNYVIDYIKNLDKVLDGKSLLEEQIEESQLLLARRKDLKKVINS